MIADKGIDQGFIDILDLSNGWIYNDIPLGWRGSQSPYLDKSMRSDSDVFVNHVWVS